eukprot:SAG31_NODE_7715_length_1610_cov_1.799471_1_plen_70_part_00
MGNTCAKRADDEQAAASVATKPFVAARADQTAEKRTTAPGDTPVTLTSEEVAARAERIFCLPATRAEPP